MQVLAQVFGIDAAPRVLAVQEVQQLKDDFAHLVLMLEPSERPLNLTAVADILNNGSSGTAAQVFLVGDGSQV